MSRLLAPRRCPCGSGRPSRLCCGRFRRFSADDIATAFLRRQHRQAYEQVAMFSPTGLAGLQEEVATLPDQYESLVDALAGRWRPRRALSPVVRAALAQEVIALRESGSLDEYVAAAAVIDLDGAASILARAAADRVVRRRRAAGSDQPVPSAGGRQAPAPV